MLFRIQNCPLLTMGEGRVVMYKQAGVMGGQALLARWAAIGVAVLLCAPWLVPSSKVYHQLLAVLLWLPALCSLGYAAFRSHLASPDLWLYVAFAAWTLLILIVRGSEEPVSDAKVVAYVTLSLLGFLLAARAGDASVERLLIFGVLLGGVGAGLSWLHFYVLEQNPFSSRLTALGIWDTVIMAAHAVGALAVVGLAMVVGRPWRLAWLLPAGVTAIGYLAFLLSSQTRGVWLALLASLMVILVSVPRWIGLTVLFGLLLAVAAVAIYDVQMLMQRGLSYRPELWGGGLQLIAENTWFGIGFHEFKLTVPGLTNQFKHPHNLFIDTGVRLGVGGLLIFCVLWLLCLWRAWQARDSALGRALLALWLFATVSLMTDGIGLWRKPNADWLITWLPIALGLLLARRNADYASSDRPRS